MPRRLPALLVLLALPTAALAQEEAEQAPTSLDGVGRITVSPGIRFTTNTTLYDGWYGANGPGTGLERGTDPTGGGPLLTATFAYAVTDLVEVGIDLFASTGSLRLAELPTDAAEPLQREFKTLTYGALLGLRFQGVLEGIGPQGLVPFAGLLTGPTLASSKRDGGSVRESVTQAWVGSLGATLRLSARWGVTAEYRLAFLRGPVEVPTHPEQGKKYGPFSFNGGGNWFTLGVTYAFAPEPSRPMGSF